MLYLEGTFGRRVASPSPFFRGAGLAGTADIQALQNALVRYAQTTGDMSANPVVTSGELNDNTVLGALHVAWKLADKVPILKNIKNDMIGKIPGASTVLNFLTGNTFAMMSGWALLKSQSPSTVGQITQFVQNHAQAIAAGIDLASGTNAGLPATTNLTDILKITDIDPTLTRRDAGPTKIAAFDSKLGVYRVAIKNPALGDIAPKTFVETTGSTAAPTDAQLVDLKVFKKAVGDDDWWTSPYFIGGAAAATIGLGVGIWYLTK